MRYLDLLERARVVAAELLPNPWDLAPKTPSEFVAEMDEHAKAIGQTLGELSPDDLEEAGGRDAWLALVTRCVAELAEDYPVNPKT